MMVAAGSGAKLLRTGYMLERRCVLDSWQVPHRSRNWHVVGRGRRGRVDLKAPARARVDGRRGQRTRRKTALVVMSGQMACAQDGQVSERWSGDESRGVVDGRS